MSFQIIQKDWPFLIHPSLTVLLTASYEDRDTITPIAWIMPLSGEPPLVATALKETRFAYELLVKSGEFGVNVPPLDQAEKVWACGTTSGRNQDKFALTGFQRMKAERIKAPLIQECIAYLECRLFADESFGDHHLIVGEILLARVKEGLFDTCFNEKFSPCLHLRKNLFLNADWKSLRAV
ncbi:MAG: flavin reductase family protein [bacterium]